MKKISHGIEFIAFWTVTRIVQIAPVWLADKLAAGLGLLGYYLLGSRRKIAINNLKRAFKDEKSEKDIIRIAREAFKNVAREAIEFARTPVVKNNLIAYITDGQVEKFVTEAIQSGHGTIMLTGHIGNGEYLGGWLALKGLPIDFLVGRQHNPYIDKMFNNFRSVYGARLISVGVSARQALRSLNDGRLIALMSDQHATSNAVVVNFFGRPAATPRGPAAFVVKMKCPLVVCVLIREKYNRFRAIAYPPIVPNDQADPEMDIKRITQQYTAYLEHVIRLYPEQWMWTHRRWKLD